MEGSNLKVIYQLLQKHYYQKHILSLFFITNFPTELRGMYYETTIENEKITRSLDLIAPEGIGELSSGGSKSK